nr:hypothetical protein [Tanacetum cinerariifolium]
MEEYIRLEEEKTRRRGQVYNWETVTYGKIWCNDDVYDLRSIETEFLAIVLNDVLTYEVAFLCESTDAIRRILKFEIRCTDLLYRPCCKEIDDM